MAGHVQVIQARDFVRARPEGTVDLVASGRIIRDIASEGAALKQFDVLIDGRSAEVELSVTDLWYLAAALAERKQPSHRKTAVLTALDRFDHAKFFQLCATNRGLKIGAFTDYEDAMEWLLRDE
jgi:hypothetical protein